MDVALSRQESRNVQLEELIKQTQPGFLRPLCFFVSWQGVMTLAYSGFPDTLLALKAWTAEKFPSLPKENPGSQWPKTTLGALRDKRRLTPQQLQDLVAMCKEESVALMAFMQSEPSWMKVPVRTAAVAVYLCRSLERVLSLKEVAMEGSKGPSPPPVKQVSVDLSEEEEEDGEEEDEVSGLSCKENEMEDSDDDSLDDLVEMTPNPEARLLQDRMKRVGLEGAGVNVNAVDREIGVKMEERDRVKRIVAECDDEEYWFAASKDGSRETHYREPALGCTLMIPLGQYVSEDRDYAPKELFAFILMFQERVDARFPGLYSWLDLKAAHVTLRGIMG